MQTETIINVLQDISSECSKNRYCFECKFYSGEIGSCILDAGCPASWNISKLDRNKFSIDIREMDLSVRAFNVLFRNGYRMAKDITDQLDKDPNVIRNLPHLGSKTYAEILAKIDELTGSNYSNI